MAPNPGLRNETGEQRAMETLESGEGERSTKKQTSPILILFSRADPEPAAPCAATLPS